jgi:hypothetical protein
MRWLSLFLACQHLNWRTNLRECEDQSWFIVQALPVFRFGWCQMFSCTPGCRPLRTIPDRHTVCTRTYTHLSPPLQALTTRWQYLLCAWDLWSFVLYWDSSYLALCKGNFGLCMQSRVTQVPGPMSVVTVGWHRYLPLWVWSQSGDTGTWPYECGHSAEFPFPTAHAYLRLIIVSLQQLQGHPTSLRKKGHVFNEVDQYGDT